jgi:hypothetical protein
MAWVTSDVSIRSRTRKLAGALKDTLLSSQPPCADSRAVRTAQSERDAPPEGSFACLSEERLRQQGDTAAAWHGQAADVQAAFRGWTVRYTVPQVA